MATPKFDRDRAIRILVDAAAVGDAAACDHWKISARTLQRYRERLASDPELAAAVARKRKQLDDDWRTARRTFLRNAIGKLQELVASAGPDRIRDVAGAIKIVGDLEVVSGALGDGEQSGADRQGQVPAEAARDPQAESSPAIH